MTYDKNIIKYKEWKHLYTMKTYSNIQKQKRCIKMYYHEIEMKKINGTLCIYDNEMCVNSLANKKEIKEVIKEHVKYYWGIEEFNIKKIGYGFYAVEVKL